ncbi:LolA family protein [Tundrisphaera sp. TA3]|uniref:LolA family protein n=1 Tax=Tundrisphaera sp. TA3 TaxID=3435775 RepID=UPI003EB96263
MSWCRILPSAAACLVCIGSSSATLVLLSQDAPVPPPVAVPDPVSPKTDPVPSEPAKPAGPADAKAEAAFARMVRAYATARSYEDTGEITTVFNGPNVNFANLLRFSTKYERPTRFRFEFSDIGPDGRTEKSHYVIWSAEAPERAKSWWTIQPKVSEVSMRQALGTAAGVSGRSSVNLPSLLMPGPRVEVPFGGMHDLKLGGEAEIEGVACWWIDGKSRRGDPLAIWIDKDSSLVRKIVHQFTIPGATKVEATTIYRPKLDGPIPAEAFEFVPPANP